MTTRQQYWAQKQIEREEQGEAGLAKRQSEKLSLAPVLDTGRQLKLLRERMIAEGFDKRRNIKLDNFRIAFSWGWKVVTVRVDFIVDCVLYSLTLGSDLMDFVNSLDMIPFDVFEKGTLKKEGIEPSDAVAELNFEEDQRGKRQYENLESSM